MGTCYFGCGCFVSSTMGETNNILNISLCLHHAHNSNLQTLLHQVSTTLREQINTNPGYWDKEWHWIDDYEL